MKRGTSALLATKLSIKAIEGIEGTGSDIVGMLAAQPLNISKYRLTIRVLPIEDVHRRGRQLVKTAATRIVIEPARRPERKA